MNAITNAQRIWLLTPSLFRTARKQHRCDSFELLERPAPDGSQTERVSCPTPILVGEQYVEYLGESAAFSIRSALPSRLRQAWWRVNRRR